MEAATISAGVAGIWTAYQMRRARTLSVAVFAFRRIDKSASISSPIGCRFFAMPRRVAVGPASRISGV